MRDRTARGRIWILLLLVGLLPGCRSQEEAPAFVYNEAQIDHVEVRTQTAAQIRYEVFVQGTLRDACTRIQAIRQRLEGHKVLITITTKRPIDEVCAQTLTPFDATIPLTIEPLEAGEYTVSVNGMTESFVVLGQGGPPIR